ncbi:hypothetical protein GOEFS_039_00230 [Gordonia effusa NBRC 100432]|uniref:Uncharacterized protein n=1 Tax=Gordonia effusa NBRC 100432 TaxID=1077974 RepID=H0QY88_9ACTN|nr:hypothetical protein [Gordonia effusa]GAB17789.1 hypothetical protein GOEFS_039_00230 [Gordonia effusa NBRC 100432]
MVSHRLTTGRELAEIWSGQLELPSGVIVVSNVTADVLYRAEVTSPAYVEVFSDGTSEPERVFLSIRGHGPAPATN